MPLELLRPEWDAPANVGVAMSTRAGGVSVEPFDSLNLGACVDDDGAAVAENRRRFADAVGARPVWLRQVHGAGVLRLVPGLADERRVDAAWTSAPDIACTVLVADCMPVLFTHRDGRAVAAAHAGWRGLAGGVLENTVAALCEGVACEPGDLLAWLGPCIGPRQFEVGADVLAAFPDDPACFSSRPRADGSPRWLADLPQLARRRLARTGVQRVSGGTLCTVEEPSRFFSFRRDGRCGRLAAAIWRR